MKTTKVYVNDSLVVLYGEWPVEPHFIEADAQSYKDYEQALKKAIAEAVPFEDQIRVSKLLLTQAGISSGESQEEVGPRFARAFKPGFYEVSGIGVEVHLDRDNIHRAFIIKPLSSGEKEEQTQDELWKLVSKEINEEGLWVYEDWDGFKITKKGIAYLKEQFTLTRKTQ